MRTKASKRLLSLAMIFALLLSFAVPVGAAEESADNQIPFEKVDNSVVSSTLPDREVAREVTKADNTPGAEYMDTDVVRVSIILEKPSTIEAGYSTTEIASNTAAMRYRDKLADNQESVISAIESVLGQELDVVWNLTLATNLISAYVEYGQIAEIAGISGVADVVIETQYEPAVVSAGGANPNMSTSSAMIGSATAYLEGYTGAGSRIAIIDTGIDDDHQSFDAGAYEYALQQLAEAAGVDYEEYVAGLNLLTAEEVASVADHLNASFDNSFEASKTYLSAKIPYAYNYIDNNFVINHDSDSQGEHGSHVTGIAAANSYIPDGNGGYVSALDTVQTQGVAPEAQIITMKVFGKGGGAYDSDYMAAIEDAIILGADAVNLSLGSANPGFSSDSNAYYQSIMDSLTETDTVVSISASNSYSWAEFSYNFAGYVNGTGYPYSDDVSFDTVGSPGSYTNSLSVASADNTGFTGAYLNVDGTLVFYTETTGYANAPMTSISGEQRYVMIDSAGTDEEFAAIEDVLKGAIAVCNRGTISFFEKANAAVAHGAIGVIIVNNTAGTISMDLTGYEGPAPCVSITQADGELLKSSAEYNAEGDYYQGSLTVSSSISSVTDPDADVVMSDFSSWGVPGSLELKPEITAPGGSIYSVNGAIAGGASYETMSGTSMAAPQVAGMSALLAQYIRENGLEEKTGLSSRALAQSLLMSTAVPLREADSGYEYYSVLKQGAGLANVGDAVSASSYIRMGADATDSYADGKVKAELGDDPDKTGTYSFSFTINNLSGVDETYALSADLFTQDVFDWYVNENLDEGGYLDTWTTSLAYGAVWTVDGKTLKLSDKLTGLDFNGDGLVNTADGQALLDLATGVRESISHDDLADLNGDGLINSYDAYLFFSTLSTGYATVPANGSVKVTVTLSLTDEQKAELDASYPNGAYIEGFVYASALTSGEGVLGTTHSIPVLGYYGNWSDPSMYDLGSWTEQYNADATGEATRWNYMGTYYSNYVTVKYAGDNNEYTFGGNPWFYEEYDESRNAINAENGDAIASAVYSLIRNAAAGKLTVTNTTTGEVEYEQEFGETYSAFCYVSDGSWYYTSYSEPLSFVPAGSEGDSYVVSLTMVPEYYVNKDGSVDWDALGDGATLSIPFAIDNTAPELLAVSDDEDQIGITVVENQNIAAVFLYNSDGDYVGGFTGDELFQNEDGTFSAFVDASELEDDVYLLQAYDYAMNCSTYRLFFNVEPTDEVTGVTVTPDSLNLMRGASATVTAAVLPVNVSDDTVSWTSSDENIATVNENGVVTGVSVGECVITATSNLDETVSAECVVTVKTAAVTLGGALQDKDGNPLLFFWDMENDNAWTPYAELDNDISSTAWDWLFSGSLYQQSSAGYMYEVDIEDGTTLNQSASSVLFGAPMQDMDFAFYYYAVTGTPVLYGVYENYVVYSNPMENDFSYGYDLSSYLSNYTGASGFVALAWGGFDMDDEGNVYDVLCALDNNGYLWLLYVIGEDVYSFGIVETDLALSFPTYAGYQFCSMVFDDYLENIYLSYFTGSTNEIYVLAYDEDAECFVSSRIGDVGDGVWPATLFVATPNEDMGYDANRAMTPVASYLSAAATHAEKISIEAESIVPNEQPASQESETVPTGGLNSTVATAKPNGDIRVNPATVTVTVTAKDVDGVDVVSHNGVATVTYDADLLTLVNVSYYGDYTSENVKEGAITFGYVSLAGIAAGNPVAELTFEMKDSDAATEVTIDYEETNDTTPDYIEELTVQLFTEHNYGETVFVWSNDYTSASAVFSCEWCGDLQTIEAEVTSVTTEATCTQDGEIVYTAVVTFDGETYTDTKTVTLPATGHTYGEPVFNWSEDYTCEAIFTCKIDGDVQTVAAEVTSVTTNATCNEDGAIIYTAAATFDGKTYTDSITVSISATGHTYGEPTFVWDEENGCTATFTCEDGDDTRIVTAVVTSQTDEDGTVTYTATVTFNGETYTDTKVAEAPAQSADPEDPTEDATKPTEPAKSDLPQTGDNAHLGLWIGVMVVAAVAVVVLLILLKQKKGKYEK